MSCWTAYMVRDTDDSLRYAVDKYGEWRLTSVDARDAILDFAGRHGVALERVSDDAFDHGYCQGVLLDVPARRYRCFPCYGDREPLVEIDAAIRSAPVWHGWDAGLAMGGREEFAALLPPAARIITRYDVLDKDVPAPDVLPADGVGWWQSTVDVLTVVDTAGVAAEYRLSTADTHPVHPLLAWLRRGPAAIEALGAPPAYQPDDLDEVRSAAVVDHAGRFIGYSPTQLVPARLLDAVRSAWPQWSVGAT